jgi:tRNA A-37 threonylcarbamoyl transferase component Bud32
MADRSNAPLVDALRQSRLLEPARLEEVARTLQPRFPDPQALAGELIRRGWLTSYQADQLLQGRGQELVLGPYLFLERLGEGGMGQVFKARHRHLGRTVAIKLIRTERLDSPEAVRRFEREVRAAAHLDHPNVVLALDAAEIGGTHLLVMEYVEGATDLSRLVRTNGPLPWPQACDYIRQAALGLQHAFEKGLVHRDIKPANLLLTADGKTVKILDLGLARLDPPAGDAEQSSTLTQAGAVMGTPDYIAPEQALEPHTVDIRADLYSLGCTFYFLLTGRPPFPTGTLLQKLNKHQHENPPAVEALRSDVPLGVAGVVRKLMAKNPEDRYRTPAEVAAALAVGANEDRRPPEEAAVTVVQARQTGGAETVVAAGVGQGHRSDPRVFGPPPRLRKRTGARRLLLAGVGTCGVLLAGAAILWLLWKRPAEQPPQANRSSSLPPGAATDKRPARGLEPWLKEVTCLPADRQVAAVAGKLKESNPGFDAKVTPKIEGGVVTELQVLTDEVTDLRPVRALAGLKALDCSGTRGKGRLTDLSPLRGMKLTTLACAGTQVTDLSPLRGMRLKELNVWYTPVSDLSPLKGMDLRILGCGGTEVSDLSALKGMKLQELNIWGTPVSDLSPLQGMGLTTLACAGTRVSDLSPLKGMELTPQNLERASSQPSTPRIIKKAG